MSSRARDPRRLVERKLSLRNARRSDHIVTFLCLLTLYRNCSLKPLYVILLALFNDLTLTPVSKDYADASKDPVDPRLKPIIILAVVYALGARRRAFLPYPLPSPDDAPVT